MHIYAHPLGEALGRERTSTSALWAGRPPVHATLCGDSGIGYIRILVQAEAEQMRRVRDARREELAEATGRCARLQRSVRGLNEQVTTLTHFAI